MLLDEFDDEGWDEFCWAKANAAARQKTVNRVLINGSLIVKTCGI